MLALLLLACATDNPSPAPPATRAEAAYARLEGTEGGRLLRQSIDAHGGLDAWYDAGGLRFTFAYVPAGKPEAIRHTVNLVDIETSRVRQEQVGGESVLGWDGEQAWIAPSEDAFPSSPRFWALTPYYFVGMPWVLADPGTRHERLEDAPLAGETMTRVKVSYDPGTGDAPDDYYVAWLDPEDHTLRALTYIVSSPEVFPDGGHSPEKRLTYLRPVTVDGLQFAQRYEGFILDVTGRRTAPASTVTITDIEVHVPVSDATFQPVEGAVTGL